MVPHSFTSYHPPFHQLPAHFLKSFSLFHLLQSLTWIFVYSWFFVYFILKIFFLTSSNLVHHGLGFWSSSADFIHWFIFVNILPYFPVFFYVLRNTCICSFFLTRFLLSFYIWNKTKKLAVLQFSTPYHPHTAYIQHRGKTRARFVANVLRRVRAVNFKRFIGNFGIIL